MAGDWIKYTTELPDKNEVIGMAARLNVDELDVTGRLMHIWAWADQATEDGNAPSVTKTFIDRRARMSGFADAMIAEGWLQVENGTVRFPNFERHNSQTAKRRALTLRRVAKHKAAVNARGNAKGNARSVTPSVTIETETEIEKKNPPNPPEGGRHVPAFASEVFDFWKETTKGVLPSVTARTDKRIKAIERARKQDGFDANWQESVRRVLESPFLCGQNDRGWKANFDWWIKEGWAKALDGVYKFGDKRAAQQTELDDAAWRKMMADGKAELMIAR